MTHQIRIQPNTANETVLDSSDIVSLDFARTHTGIGDWRADVGFDLSLEDETLSEILLEDGSTLLFRGYILSVESDNDRAITTLSGTGIAEDLTDAATTRTFSNIFAHEAIEDYWADETSFSATVTTPSADTTVSDEQAQEADTNTEFSNITSNIANTDPLEVRNSNLELLQSFYFSEAENFDTQADATSVTDSSYSDGEGIQLTDLGDFITFDFTLEYDMPESAVGVAHRWERDAADTNSANVDIRIDGTDIRSNFGSSNDDMAWDQQTSWSGGDLAAGSHTVKIEVVQTDNTPVIFDCLGLYDTRYSYTFDNTVDANGFLSGPELYPDAESFTFDEAQTPWNVQEATVNSTWNDTSNNQRIQLRLDQQTYFPSDGTEDNTDSVTTDFGSEFGTDIQARVRFSRFGSRTTATPTTGFNGQNIEDWEIVFDGNDIAIIDELTVEGDHLSNLQRLHSFAGMRFSIQHAENSKPVDSFRVGDQSKTQPDWDIINRRKTKDLANYANEVTVRGAVVSGSRLTQTIQDDSEVSAEGTKHAEKFDTTLDTQADVDAEARKFLAESIREKDQTGELQIAPLGLDPGFSYPVDWSDGTQDTIGLEEIRYRISNGDLQGTLQFNFSRGLSETLAQLKRDANTLYQA